MPEPTSHTAAAIALSGFCAGTICPFLGLDPVALFWALLGAICSRSIQPSITSRGDILIAAGIGIASIVLGSFGSMILILVIVEFFPKVGVLDYQTVIAIPAFMIGILGHEIIVRAIAFVREWKGGLA